jgi:hypothetical protein
MSPEERESFRGTIAFLRNEKKKTQEQLATLEATVTKVRGIEKILSTVVVPTNDSQDGYDTSSPRSEDSIVAPAQQQSFLGRVLSLGPKKSLKSSSSSSSSKPEKKKRKAGSTLFDSFDTF